MAEVMIDVKELVKTYGPTVAVDRVSFQVREGEILGFLGPNGAGKSTTMRILTTYLVPDHGTANIKGYDILEQPLEVRRLVGYLPENVPLYNEMHVDEYLNFVAQVRQIPLRERRRRVGEIIEMVGLKAVVRKACGNLSKGYRQRVGLAQTLIHDPPVLILDEPTSGLDPYQIIEMRNLIAEISKRKAVVFSTHILQEIEAICHRIIIIKNGRIIADGTPGDLAREVLGGISVRGRILAPEGAVRESLESLTGVKEVVTEGSDSQTRFRLILTGQDDPGLLIGKLASERGWVLAECATEKSSLEDVYLAITRRA